MYCIQQNNGPPKMSTSYSVKSVNMLPSMAHLSGVIKYEDLDMERLSCIYAGGHNLITSILKSRKPFPASVRQRKMGQKMKQEKN